MFAELTLYTLAFLAAAAFCAGLIDAIAGGGGLIQLPAMLIGLAKTETVVVLGTNKVPSIFGTTASALTYRRNIKVSSKLLIVMAIPAFIGSMGGASLASLIPTEVLKPLVVALLIAVLIYTWKRPQLGQIESMRHSESKRLKISAAAALVIGFYDGIFPSHSLHRFSIIDILYIFKYAFNQTFKHVQYIFLLYKTHFAVNLREFWLSVGS